MSFRARGFIDQPATSSLESGGTITGNLTITGTLGSGAATVTNLTATGTSNLQGAVDCDTSLNVDGTIHADGAIDTDSSLTVDGASTLTGTVTHAGRIATPRNPTVQAITAVTDTIAATSAYVRLSSTAAPHLLTSTPTIETAGVADGTRLTIGMVSGGSIQIQDEASVAGSKIRLISSSTITLASNDVVEFMFEADTGFWRQLGPVSALA